MFVPIDIDARDLAMEFSLSNGQVNDMMEFTIHEITAAFAREWDSYARRELRSTRDLYRRSLIVGEEGFLTGYVMLVGDLPNMLEQGAGSWDMKTNFARSGKVRYNKNGGWYLTIPFRFATPGALGENEAFSNILPKSVYKALRTVGDTRTSVQDSRQYGGGLSLSDIPAQYRAPKSRAAFSDVKEKTTFSEYKHKTSIYQGIIRNKKVYERADQSQYTSFRRASSNSDPNSWIHKGFLRRNFAGRALESMPMDTVVDNAIDDFLSAQGF